MKAACINLWRWMPIFDLIRYFVGNIFGRQIIERSTQIISGSTGIYFRRDFQIRDRRIQWVRVHSFGYETEELRSMIYQWDALCGFLGRWLCPMVVDIVHILLSTVSNLLVVINFLLFGVKFLLFCLLVLVPSSRTGSLPPLNSCR